MNKDKTQEALKLALEALEEIGDQWGFTSKRTIPNRKAAITAICEALAEQPAQQEVWKLVPVEPTPEMLKAADDGDDEYTRRNFGPAVHRVMQGPYDHYIAMLNAAPQPAQQQEPVFWYRPCSNGMYEGPIHNAQIERVRKESGAWHPLYTSPPAQRKPWAGLTDDTLRLDELDQNCWDLRCFSHSDGEDYGWRVIEHHMGKPHERTVAEVYCNDPRKAIDAAIEAAHGITGEQK